MKLPFMQEARRFEKRLLVWDGDPNPVPTKGRGFIWVDTTARWRIADAKKFLEDVASEAVYERMISLRRRIAAQFRSEGEGRSAEILGTMEKELRQIRSTAYRRVQEVQGQADAEATPIYGHAFNKGPEFYAFLRTLESCKEKTNMNSVLILTTGSDFYHYIKQTGPGKGGADECRSVDFIHSRGDGRLPGKIQQIDNGGIFYETGKSK